MEVSEPQKSINEVVSSVKSEGLFDQFRKECLEEFDNMVYCMYKPFYYKKL